jgi:ubiquinone biosynthesis protein Coq4
VRGRESTFAIDRPTFLSMMTIFGAPFHRLSRAWATLRGYHAGVVLLRDPSRLDMVFVMDRAMPPEEREALLARIRGHEVARAALRERPRVGVDVAALARLPEGTLGRALADFLRANALDPRSIPTLAADDDGAFADAHLYETHDIWHAVTGFDADVAGEVGLQAFYAAQLGGRLPTLLLGGGILQAALREPGDFARRMDALTRGWEMGKRARQLFGVRWDRLWGEPLARVRADLNVAAPS